MISHSIKLSVIIFSIGRLQDDPEVRIYSPEKLDEKFSIWSETCQYDSSIINFIIITISRKKHCKNKTESTIISATSYYSGPCLCLLFFLHFKIVPQFSSFCSFKLQQLLSLQLLFYLIRSLSDKP